MLCSATAWQGTAAQALCATNRAIQDTSTAFISLLATGSYNSCSTAAAVTLHKLVSKNKFDEHRPMLLDADSYDSDCYAHRALCLLALVN
jgi:hypothetical protein